MHRPEHHAQGDWGGGKHRLDAAGRDALSCVATVQVTPGRGAEGAGHCVQYLTRAVLRLDLVLFLVVEEVTPGTIGAVAGIPEFLAPLGLIFALFTNITHFVFPMSKLTVIPIKAGTFFLETPANLSFESRIVFVGQNLCFKSGVFSTQYERVCYRVAPG